MVVGKLSFIIAITAYIHFFAIFGAVVIYISGFFFVNKTKQISYILSGIGAIVLYIPYVPYFLIQIKGKGVGDWLTVPEWDFFIYYFKFAFHFSPLFLLFFIASLAASLGYAIKTKRKLITYMPPLWWMFVSLTAFIYSRQVSSVMQVSCLLFVFPGILWFATQWIEYFKKSVIFYIVITFIITIGIYTLVIDRKYYTITKNGLYQCSIDELKCMSEIYNKDSTLFISNSPYIPQMLHVDKYAAEVVYIKDYNNVKIQEIFNSEKFESVAVMADDYFPDILALTADNFYNHVIKRTYDRGEFHFFTKKGTSAISEWDTIAEKKYDSAETHIEFIPITTISLDTTKMKSWQEIDIVFRFYRDSTTPDFKLVTDLVRENKTIFWQGIDATQSVENKDSISVIYCSIPFPHIKYAHKELMLKTYIWNYQKTNIKPVDAAVTIRKANKYRYSLVEKINTE